MAQPTHGTAWHSTAQGGLITCVDLMAIHGRMGLPSPPDAPMHTTCFVPRMLPEGAPALENLDECMAANVQLIGVRGNYMHGHLLSACTPPGAKGERSYHFHLRGESGSFWQKNYADWHHHYVAASNFVISREAAFTPTDTPALWDVRVTTRLIATPHPTPIHVGLAWGVAGSATATAVRSHRRSDVVCDSQILGMACIARIARSALDGDIPARSHAGTGGRQLSLLFNGEAQVRPRPHRSHTPPQRPLTGPVQVDKRGVGVLWAPTDQDLQGRPSLPPTTFPDPSFLVYAAYVLEHQFSLRCHRVGLAGNLLVWPDAAAVGDPENCVLLSFQPQWCEEVGCPPQSLQARP